MAIIKQLTPIKPESFLLKKLKEKDRMRDLKAIAKYEKSFQKTIIPR